MIQRHKKIFGWVFIIIGLFIVLTPFTPGSILLLVGAEMVFGDWPEWKKFKERVKNYFWKWGIS